MIKLGEYILEKFRIGKDIDNEKELKEKSWCFCCYIKHLNKDVPKWIIEVYPPFYITKINDDGVVEYDSNKLDPNKEVHHKAFKLFKNNLGYYQYNVSSGKGYAVFLPAAFGMQVIQEIFPKFKPSKDYGEFNPFSGGIPIYEINQNGLKEYFEGLPDMPNKTWANDNMDYTIISAVYKIYKNLHENS